MQFNEKELLSRKISNFDYIQKLFLCFMEPFWKVDALERLAMNF